MRTRRILGIDPGSRVTGFGIIELSAHGKQPICLAGGCVRLTAIDMPTRLGQLFGHIKELVDLYKPTELAIEKVFVHKNALSALKLGQARGVAIAAVMTASIPVFEYAPKQIKLAVVGRGGADKAQVQHMIQILLNLLEKPQADAADALAVALCHLHTAALEIQIPKVPARRTSNARKQWTAYDRTNTRKID